MYSVAPSPSFSPGTARPYPLPTPHDHLEQSLPNILYDHSHMLAQQTWQTPPLDVFPSNPYPSVQSPPSMTLKVWILDCKSCGTFLTNRGMQAVLSLRPNVALYSSDALPVNCSAYMSSPEALRPPSYRPPSSNSSQRTCECLTQTLCCHGCGANVGYMIVIPCNRCTSSFTSSNRATNGHRFVFHSSEIIATDRHYIPDEPGILPYEYPPVPPILSLIYPHHHPQNTQSRLFSPHYQSSPAYRQEYLPTPPAGAPLVSSTSVSSIHETSPFAEQHNRSIDNSHESPPHAPRSLPHFEHPYPFVSVPSQSPSILRSSFADSDSPDDSIPPPLVSPSYPYELPSGQLETPPPCMLKPGDVLYWHHLMRQGEIPGMKEDVRARQRSIPAVKRLPLDR
ncbi:uncharacterized protein BT62DRAFT_102772 [Guyanagaster necrorhizus]|uniref:Uncharacterized protein n=1 Tax=Guyanagaster necrorhizus TaxID=856835 RepID=A0A9P7VRP6_9AGAR|nr:uncharacterized protein BT62DRAFT_102772 [Guyanagaster necrorhizus MCA 3950]KAG7446206.1 hypothetical protein BT62DRAFT_102772 [Guyanagaster necrorhizus MCA 3950]